MWRRRARKPRCACRPFRATTAAGQASDSRQFGCTRPRALCVASHVRQQRDGRSLHQGASPATRTSALGFIYSQSLVRCCICGLGRIRPADCRQRTAHLWSPTHEASDRLHRDGVQPGARQGRAQRPSVGFTAGGSRRRCTWDSCPSSTYRRDGTDEPVHRFVDLRARPSRRDAGCLHGGRSPVDEP